VADQRAALINAAADLIESLDLPHKARVVDPLVRRLARALKPSLRHGFATAKFSTQYTAITRKAYEAGARQAMADLGPVAVQEGRAEDYAAAQAALQKARRNPLPHLPDPARMATLATQQIDWTDPDFSSERATMIAEYEVSTAFHDGMKAMADLWRGGNGPTEKAWQTEDDPCPECADNADDGFIDSEAPFDSGDFEPPAHPNCRCSLEYRATPE
jgi:hypothetical protein